IEKSLPQSKLTYYNDPFDKLRADLWEKSQLTYNKAQMANFKLADMVFKNGKLHIETKTGCFSKGGLLTKYAFRGDFDIQIDCHMDFLGGKFDIDQRALFSLIEKDKEMLASDQVFAQLLRKPGDRKTLFHSICRTGGKFKRGRTVKIDDFHGTIRFVRKKSKIGILYRIENSSNWKDLGSFYFTSKDLRFGFVLQNFDYRRTSIKAESQIAATFDNFKINAADKIAEEEI
ncbi:hypothetical protein KA005_84575, partial [bacterium]|nr:hypothetical protein [bacterium]